jgi:hypothetical protein
MAHFIGNKGKSSASSDNQPSPQPSPCKGEGASIAVLQFVALARGEWGVQVPQSPFRVVGVTAEERYCLGCCGVRWFDVVEGVRWQVSGGKCQVSGGKCQVVICRCCGKDRENEIL